MGFRQGSYAKIWKIEDKGNYFIAQISISKKKQNSDEYITEFQGFARLVGDAHESGKSLQIGTKGASVKIASCDVTTNYDKKTEKTYTNYVIFGFESPDGENSTNNSTRSTKNNKPSVTPNNAADEDDDLPF